MLKKYDELRKVDVSDFCEYRKAKDDRGKDIDVKYLNWAKCIDLLHKNGAETVYFEPCTNSNGSSLFMSDQVFTDSKGNTNRCYEVRVKIVIDDLQFEAQFPLMNGSNPVKDNSMSQQRVWNAQTRAFVKGVAMRTGLGFDLWINDKEGTEAEDDLNRHSIFAIKERLQIAYTKVLSKGYTTREIAEKLHTSEEIIKVIFTYFDQINRFEQDLNRL